MKTSAISIFLQLRFYVKSIFEILEILKIQLFAISEILNVDFWSISALKKCKNLQKSKFIVSKCVKLASFEASDLSTLISCKICVASAKFWNYLFSNELLLSARYEICFSLVISATHILREMPTNLELPFWYLWNSFHLVI